MNAPADLHAAAWSTPHPALGGLTLLDHLFNRLDGLYPVRWRSAFPSETAIANWRAAWGEALVSERITPADVARGLAACQRHFEWPPSLAEFLGACRPQLNADAALYEAIEQMEARRRGADVWTHPAIYWAAARLGEHELLSASFSAMRPRFERALRELEHRADLPPVPPRTPALPAPLRRADPAVANDCLAKLHALHIGAAPGREWARKIMRRAESGEKLPVNLLNHAKAALGVD